MKRDVNVFIVDDNKIFALALKGFLETSFENIIFKTHLFETGEECMEQFSRLDPELIILDYYLNTETSIASDGLQVLDKIKRSNSKTSVIMLTSNDHIDIALKSFRYGASDYVVKGEGQFQKIMQSISKIFREKELAFKNKTKEKLLGDRENANKELALKNAEKEKWSAELDLANVLKEEAQKSKLLIEVKNKDITDSIHYAKRIQQAKLPKKEDIYSALSDCFVLFKPKDIVSGDFYFFSKNEDAVFIAAADCTGHGVPGAFMSIIGSGKLDEAVAFSSNPSAILNHLNIGMKSSLHQSDNSESTRDGMDIAFCAIDKENRIINYSGANRPLWLIRKNKLEVEEIKGTKKSIGGLTEESQLFSNHELKLEKGDTFYIATDGYADQFGGESGKKIMSRKFKEILVSIQDKSMEEQKKHLDDYVEKWKIGIEQVDDILVIGVRL